MLKFITRQQELRLHLLSALYKGFVEDAHAYFDLEKLDLQQTPNLPRAEPDEDDTPELPRADFKTQAPAASEARAAALYLLERGLIAAIPPEAMQSQNLDPASLWLRITANGADVLENFALANYAKSAERPVGFNFERSAQTMGMPLARKDTP
jgi:hypothetical protein